jgi:hypothetical protein
MCECASVSVWVSECECACVSEWVWVCVRAWVSEWLWVSESECEWISEWVNELLVWVSACLRSVCAPAVCVQCAVLVREWVRVLCMVYGVMGDWWVCAMSEEWICSSMCDHYPVGTVCNVCVCVCTRMCVGVCECERVCVIVCEWISE